MDQKNLVKIWELHTTAEFVRRDVEATMATMTDDPYIKIIPTNIYRRGKEEVRALYRNTFIPSLPDEFQAEILNRVIGEHYIVDEERFTFRHSKRMEWLLPNVEPTYKTVELLHIVFVEFSGDRVAGERVYWDQASVLRQVGLLKD
jgi:carboxymethylenebutenolidase